MKGYRFYQEFGNKRKPETANGNVLAVLVGSGFWGQQHYCYECVGAVYDYPDSPVASTAVAVGYLWDKTKRVSEHKARELHPQLFWYLDSPC